MTPNEVFTHLNGFLQRFDLVAQLVSGSTSVIASPHYKRGIKPRDIYQPIGEDPPDEETIEQRRKQFELAKKTMGPEAIPVDRDDL